MIDNVFISELAKYESSLRMLLEIISVAKHGIEMDMRNETNSFRMHEWIEANTLIKRLYSDYEKIYDYVWGYDREKEKKKIY